jgi:hypothetical protein
LESVLQLVIHLLFCADKGKKYPVKVSAVEIIPDPVQPGQPTTFNISASTGMVCLAAADSTNFALLFVADLFMLHTNHSYFCHISS